PLGQGPSRADGVDANIVARQLARDTSCEIDQRRVGHTPDEEIGRRRARCGPSHQDDMSATPLLHRLAQRAHQAQTATRLRLPRLIKLLIAESEETALRIACGAVDEKVHAAEPSTRKLHDTLDLAEQIKIGADEMGCALVAIATGIPL